MRFTLGLSPSSGARRRETRPVRHPEETWPGDERAAARFAAGEPGSLDLIVRHYASDLFPLAARLAGPETGEALLEEAFFRALSARNRYRGDPPLGVWLEKLVLESAGGKPKGGETSDIAAAPPFALASRLVARLEEKERGPLAPFRRLGLLPRRTRLLIFAGVSALALVWALAPRREAPSPAPTRGDDAVAVYFDSSSVVREAVTPPGRVPIVSVFEAGGRSSGWRLVGSGRGERIPTGLTALYRLTLSPKGVVISFERLFSVPSVPPKAIDKLLQGLIFEAVPGHQRSDTVQIRVVAE